MESEILVNLSLRLPQADRRALADHLAPVIKEAIIAGGDSVVVSLQPYDPDKDPEGEE
jgi:hypothetical protein